MALTVGSGNYFYGCRAWKNCDDGWDGYMRGADDPSTTIENCWAFRNGYLEDGSDPGTQTNGNGFKMGGSDDKTLAEKIVEPGEQRISINVSDLKDGLYICQIRVNEVPVIVSRIIKTHSGN
jgi:hypothetical protein